MSDFTVKKKKEKRKEILYANQSHSVYRLLKK